MRKIERRIEISISTPFNRRFMRNVAEVGSSRTSERHTFVCRRKNVVDDSDDDGDDDDVNQTSKCRSIFLQIAQKI